MGVLNLVPPAVSGDTVQALEYLLQEARAGRLVGLAWVCMIRGRLYEVDAAGEAKRLPTYARGLLRRLDDELAKIDDGSNLTAK